MDRLKRPHPKRPNPKRGLFQTLPYSATDDTEFLPNLSPYRKRSFNNLFSDPPLSLGRNAENEITDILADRRSWHLSNDRAIVYYAKGDYQQSLQLHVKNLRNVEDSKRILIAETYRNMGICFLALQKYQDAKKLFWKYFFIADELKSNFLISSACHYLLELYDYELTDHLSKSSKSLEKVYENIEALKKKREKANLSLKGINISDNRFRAPFERAIKVHERVLENGLIDKILIAHNHLAIADLYINLRDYAEAMKHLIKAEPYAKDNVEKLRMIQLKKFQSCFDNNQYRKAITIMQHYKSLSSGDTISIHLANIKLVDAAKHLKNTYDLKQYANRYKSTSKTVEDTIGMQIAEDILSQLPVKSFDSNKNASNKNLTEEKAPKKSKRKENWNTQNEKAITDLANSKIKEAKGKHVINIKLSSNKRNMVHEMLSSTLNMAICHNINKEYLKAIKYLEILIKNYNHKNKALQYIASYFLIDSYERLLYRERKRSQNINTDCAKDYQKSIKAYEKKMSKLDKNEIKLEKLQSFLGKNIEIHENALVNANNANKKHNLIILGHLYSATKQFDSAIEKFEEGLKLTIDKAKNEIYWMLYKCSRANQDNKKIIYYLNKYLKNNPNYTGKCFAYEALINFNNNPKNEFLEPTFNKYRSNVECFPSTITWAFLNKNCPELMKLSKSQRAKSESDLTSSSNNFRGRRRLRARNGKDTRRGKSAGDVTR